MDALELVSIAVEKKISDSGYGSNKSNSNSRSQQSFGSSIKSRSQRSSHSSQGQALGGGKKLSTQKSEHRDRIRSNDLPQVQVSPTNNFQLLADAVGIVSPTQTGPGHKANVSWTQVFEERDFHKGATTNEAGFTAVLSLHESRVVYYAEHTNETKVFQDTEICLGQPFINFVHPTDRTSFAEKVKGVGRTMTEKGESYYCRIKVSTQPSYAFVEMTMKLKEINVETGYSVTVVPHIIITATKIKSAFEYPDESVSSPCKFTTRHWASCCLGDFDTVGIKYLGHSPQDLIGSSILDYYHPQDMNQLKEIYEEVMFQQGRPFKSKPYRFRTFNGTFAWIETDWSCFINPWSSKLEFIIGQHRVVKGPPNPNVFDPPNDELKGISLELMEDWRVVQDQIKTMLTETISRRVAWSKRPTGVAVRRRKPLGTQFESVFEPMPKSWIDSDSDCSDTVSLLAKDTVMLGEISPYHDHAEEMSGSNESSESPPSYGQLNYRENIERFFHSYPKTTHSNESADKMENNRSSGDEDSKVLCLDYSSGSNNGNWSGSNESRDGEMEASLTQDLLAKHNEMMEKSLTQCHKEHRVKVKHHLRETSGNPKLKRAAVWPSENPKPYKSLHLEPCIQKRVETSQEFCLLVVVGVDCTGAESSNSMNQHGRPVQLGVFDSQRCNNQLPRCYKSPAFLEKVASYFQHPLNSPQKLILHNKSDDEHHFNQRLKRKQESASDESQEPESCSSSMQSLLKTDTMSLESCLENTFEPEIPFETFVVPPTQYSPDLLLKYRLPQIDDSTEIVSRHLNALALSRLQPSCVNTQLSQLYAELQTENRVPHELLEDERTTSSGNGSNCSELKVLCRVAEQYWENSDYVQPVLMFD